MRVAREDPSRSETRIIGDGRGRAGGSHFRGAGEGTANDGPVGAARLLLLAGLEQGIGLAPGVGSACNAERQEPMTVAEAKAIALEWASRRAKEIPDFVGAFFDGSICLLNDEDPFPVTSDVDLQMAVSGAGHDVRTEVEGE